MDVKILGDAAGLDDLDDVASGIREALEAEHQWLLAIIEEAGKGSNKKQHGKHLGVGFDAWMFGGCCGMFGAVKCCSAPRVWPL